MLNINNNDPDPVPDNFYEYDYNNERLDETVDGAEIIPERKELKRIVGYTQK